MSNIKRRRIYNIMPIFQPTVWPEEEAPPEALNCGKCELRLQRSRVIWGEGNPAAPIAAILDNPGARENGEGEAVVCGTRETLQRAAYEAGLRPEDLHVTYLIKCRPLRRYDKEAARSACRGYLLWQLEERKPRLAICLGNVAVRGFFGDGALEVKNLRGAWHEAFGIPTCVSYHPLAVRRRPNLYKQFAEDWRMLAERYFRETLRQ